MTIYDYFWILASDAVCVEWGYHLGWHRGFTDAERIWVPTAKEIREKYRRLWDDIHKNEDEQ